MASIKSLNVFIFAFCFTFFNKIQPSNIYKKKYPAPPCGILRGAEQPRGIQSLIDALAAIGVYYRSSDQHNSNYITSPWKNDEDDENPKSKEAAPSYFDLTPKGRNVKFSDEENQAREPIQTISRKKQLFTNLENPVMLAVPANFKFNCEHDIEPSKPSCLKSLRVRKDLSKIMAFMIENNLEIASNVSDLFSQQKTFKDQNIFNIDAIFSDNSRLCLNYDSSLKTWNCNFTKNC